MRSRRRWLALGISILSVLAVAIPISFSGAVATSNNNENARTIVVALPGPFNGCSFFEPGATPTTDAILDLTRPSAFITNPNGTPVGESGPIASAELLSLQPETVRYTIMPGQHWSNGTLFSGQDLLDWWIQAKSLASVASDGYRDIRTLSVSPDGLTVTAVFTTPYADWDLLFRDIEAPGSPTGCAVSGLLTRPSLGPYRVTSATANRLVLTMNSNWPLDANRFGRVVITNVQTLPNASTDNYVDYTLGVNRSTVFTLSTMPTLLSRISSSNNIEELTFSPTGLTTQLAVREALSWSIERQTLIDQEFGSVTFSPSVAASALYSQGQSNYPGSPGFNPGGQATTTTTPTTANGLNDCVSCAIAILQEHGYVRGPTGWTSITGAGLSIRLGVGPSVLDHSVAALVKNDWAKIGIAAKIVSENSDASTAQAAASGRVDVALFSRPTSTTPSYSARSWAGPAYPDSYPSGVRSATFTSLFNQATAIFNPVTASATWLRLDQILLNDYWVRPLFTAPSLSIWSSTLDAVANSVTVTGFLDQLPTWTKTTVPPTS